MPEIAYVRGRYLPLSRATVSVEDRGFQFADAVYEALRTYDSRPFAVDEHLTRLFHSLEAIDLKHSFSREHLAGVIDKAVRRAEFSESIIYLQISRGVAPRHRRIPAQTEPTLVVTVRPLVVSAAQAALLENGMTLVTLPDNRWGRCDIKSVALLASVLAYQAAHQAGADDGVFVGADGLVAETTAGNLFLVRDGQLRTPPLGPRLLAGVTRAHVLQLAKTLSVPHAERPCHQDELIAADEVFVTSTSFGVIPVARVDGRSVGTGQPGPLTRRLAEQFDRLARQRSRGTAVASSDRCRVS